MCRLLLLIYRARENWAFSGERISRDRLNFNLGISSRNTPTRRNRKISNRGFPNFRSRGECDPAYIPHRRVTLIRE